MLGVVVGVVASVATLTFLHKDPAAVKQYKEEKEKEQREREEQEKKIEE